MNKYKDIGGILVIAEHDGSRLHRVTFELLGIAEYDENGSAEMISVMSLNETADGVISVIETSLKDADISEAEVVVSAGRGVKRAEDLEMIRELARLLGGQMGVSRALVDAGMANSDIQVGYSGHRVKPRLYIAIGVSGAPQHLAGMKESDTIIAVNSDPSAPIFRIADIGCVGDLYEVVPQLIEYLKNRRK